MVQGAPLRASAAWRSKAQTVVRLFGFKPSPSLLAVRLCQMPSSQQGLGQVTASLCLHFFICKTMIIVPTQQALYEDWMC